MAPAKRKSRKKSASLPRLRKSSRKSRKGSSPKRSSRSKNRRFRGDEKKRPRDDEKDQEEAPDEEPPSKRSFAFPSYPIIDEIGKEFVKTHMDPIVREFMNEFHPTYDELSTVIDCLFLKLESLIIGGVGGTSEESFRAAALSATVEWMKGKFTYGQNYALKQLQRLQEMILWWNSKLLNIPISVMEAIDEKAARTLVSHPLATNIVSTTAATTITHFGKDIYNYLVHKQPETMYDYVLRLLALKVTISNSHYLWYLLYALVVTTVSFGLDGLNPDNKQKIWSRALNLMSGETFRMYYGVYSRLSEDHIDTIWDVMDEMRSTKPNVDIDKLLSSLPHRDIKPFIHEALKDAIGGGTALPPLPPQGQRQRKSPSPAARARGRGPP